MAVSKIPSIFAATDNIRIQQLESPDGSGGSATFRPGNAGAGSWAPCGALFIGYQCLYVASMPIAGGQSGFTELHRIYDAGSANPPIALDTSSGNILIAENRQFIAILPERIKMMKVTS